MVHKKTFWLIFCSVLIVLATMTSALAVIEDDFNRANDSSASFNIGTATNSNIWAHYDSTINNWDILNNQLFVDYTSGAGNDKAEIQISQDPSRIDFIINFTDFDYTRYIQIEESAGVLAGPEADRRNIELYFLATTGNLKYRNSAGTGVEIHTGFSLNTDYTISIRNINLVTDTYDVYVDDIITESGASFYRATSQINYIGFSGGGNYYIDCLTTEGDTCGTTPEPPATLSNFSTIETADFSFNTPISVGASFGIVNSITFNNTETNSSPFYWSSVLTTNATASSTADCRIAVDGTANVENVRTLDANTLGNFMLETIPVNLSLGLHTIVTECKKTAGANYVVENSQVTQFHLHDDVTNQTINYKTIISETGFSVTSTPTLLASFNFTTSNVTNTTNINDIVVHGRATYNYDSNGDLTTYLLLRETGETCGNYTRGGSSGSSGSVGTTCLFENLNSTTTYNFDFYGFRDSGTGSVTELLMNTYNIRVNETAANNMILDKVVPAGVNTTVSTVNITNHLGGTFNVFTSAGIMVQSNTSQDAYFWIQDGSSSINYYRSLPSTGSNGNVNAQFVFTDSGTATKEYILMAYCPSGCTVSQGDLTAFVTDADVVSTGEFTVTAHNAYNGTQLQSFNITVGGSTLSTTNGSVSIISQSNINVIVEAQNFFSNTTFHDTTTNLNASLAKYTEFRANDYLGTPINNFTVNTSSNTYTTTNGVAYLPISVSDTTVTFNSDSHAIKNDLVSKTQYYNFTGYTENSVDLFIYDQDTNVLINTTTMNVIFSNNVSEANYTTSDGTLYVDNLLDGVYSVKISGGNYSLVNYVITVADDSYQVLNAYLAAVTAQVIFTVRDVDTEGKLESATVTMARLINNTWSVVYSKITDITGTAQLEYVSNVNYRFTITKDGYDTNVFYIDPIIYSGYDVYLSKTAVVTNAFDYLNVLVTFSTTSFYVNQSNNLTMLISSPDGSLEDYSFSIVSEAGTQEFTGVSATGESFQYGFSLPSSPSNQTVVISYCYDSTLGTEKCFKDVYRVIGTYGDNSFLSQKDNTFGLGLFERILIATIFVLFVAGVIGAVGGALAGTAVGLLVFGFFTFTGFIPLWSILPSVLVGVVILMGRSD